MFTSDCHLNIPERDESSHQFPSRFFKTDFIYIFQEVPSSDFPTNNLYVLKYVNINSKKKLHGLSPRANYTDRATAACRRSECQLLRIHVVSVTDPSGRVLGFLDRSRYFSIK
jgi:hypothetical protein